MATFKTLFASCEVYTLRASTLGTGAFVTLVPEGETVITDIPIRQDEETGKPITRPDGSPDLLISGNLKLIRIIPPEEITEDEKPENLPEGAINAGGFYLVPNELGGYDKWEPNGTTAGSSPEVLGHDPIAMAATGPLAAASANDAAPAQTGPLADRDTTSAGDSFSTMTRAQAEARILDNGGDKPPASVDVAGVRSLARAQKLKG